METIPAKTILAKGKSLSWFGAEYNMNVYRGCCHGCIYCDSRSTCYQNFEFDRVKVKENALAILSQELKRKIRTGVVATGAMSDPYNPFEETEKVSRHALELLNAYDFGVAIATKSDLICRDMDVLRDISTHSPVICKITITTPWDALAQKVEPGAPSSSRRFAAIEKLSGAGIFSGILLMPVLPFLQDDDKSVLALVERAANAGARFIFPGFGLTMRNGQREYFLKSLEEIFPGENLADRYRKKYGDRYQCSSPRAKHLWEIFTAACDQRGLLYKMPEIITAYKQGKHPTQLTFL